MNRNVFRIPLFPLFPACLFATSLLPSPKAAEASYPVNKSTFTLTIADGWSTLGIYPTSDSTFFLMDSATGAVAYGDGVHYNSHIDASTLVKIFTLGYTQQYARTDSSSHVRIYVTSQGNFLFVSWLVYNSKTGAGALTEFEAALATLKITASTGLRMAATGAQADPPKQRFDIQGRNWNRASLRAPSVPLFLKR